MNRDVANAFLNMDFRDMDADLVNDPAVRDLMLTQITNWPSWALPNPECASVICGMVKCLDVVTVWMVAAKGFERDIRMVLPMQREIIRGMYSVWRPHRMDLEVDQSFAPGHRYAVKLGFEYETTLKRAGTAGQDLLIYLWPQTKGVCHDG